MYNAIMLSSIICVQESKNRPFDDYFVTGGTDIVTGVTFQCLNG